MKNKLGYAESFDKKWGTNTGYFDADGKQIFIWHKLPYKYMHFCKIIFDIPPLGVLLLRITITTWVQVTVILSANIITTSVGE